ncbi:MAG: hypothetical protein WAW11_02980 [Patescibacteria group bacterium]
MKIFKLLYVVVIIIMALSWLKIKELPSQDKITTNLLRDPIQTSTTRENFSFSYRNKNYHVKPVADYELWGLVVTKNNINAWYNYYHDKNSVNLKDICVVWSKNITNGVYKDPNITFKSGEWTCYANWNGHMTNTFYPSNLSNNHLLTDDTNIQKIIRNVRVGDQIYLKGSLVDYAEQGQAEYRMTSISRTDSNQESRSGGACEIVYIDEFKILQKNQSFWHIIYNLSQILFIGLILTQLIIYIRNYRLFIKK